MSAEANKQLMQQIFAELSLVPPYKVIAQRIIAEGDVVAVEAVGQNTRLVLGFVKKV